MQKKNNLQISDCILLKYKRFQLEAVFPINYQDCGSPPKPRNTK